MDKPTNRGMVMKTMPTSHKRIYPWAEWFDGRVWRLEEGKDFKPRIDIMRASVVSTACRKGFKIQTTVQGKFLFLQATGVKNGA